MSSTISHKPHNKQNTKLVQYCSKSSALAMELLRSCTKLSKLTLLQVREYFFFLHMCNLKVICLTFYVLFG